MEKLCKGLIYKYKFNLLCIENSIELNNSELEKIFRFMPIIPNKKIFIKDNSNDYFPTKKEDLIELVTNYSQAFHLSEGSIVQSVANQIKSLNLSSDRTTNINISSNRLRHTIGSMLAKMGYSIVTISHVLGNTPKAAWYYVDLLPSNRQEIDAKLTPLLIDVVNKFMGTVTTKISDKKNLIAESKSKSIGEVKNQPTCLACIGDRPFVCYGCENFRPLVDANHQVQLTKIQNLITEKVSNGVDEATIIPLKVIEFNMQMTIVACKTSKNMIRKNVND